MAALSYISSLLLIASSCSIALANAMKRPANDRCTSATDVLWLPYQTTKALARTRQDSFTVACDPDYWGFAGKQTSKKDGVWYKMKGSPGGTGLVVDIKGIGAHVFSRIYMSDYPGEEEQDDDDCLPATFSCVPDIGSSTSISTEDPIPGFSWDWYAREGATYYIYIASDDDEMTKPASGYSLYVNMFSHPYDSSANNARRRPANDQCATATRVSDFPFQSSGNLAGAAESSFSVACNPPAAAAQAPSDEYAVWFNLSNGVWYEIEAPEGGGGMGLNVEIKGVDADVHSEVLMTTDDDGEEGRSCPDMFTCIAGMSSASSISHEDPIPARSYQWYAEEGARYYVYITDFDSPGGEYQITVNTFDDETPAGQIYLRRKN